MANKVILVIGLHNSGTSALSGMLHKLGVNMGTMTADHGASHPPHNPYGQYEDAELVGLLNRVIGYWRTPRLETLPPETQAMIGKYIAGRATPLWGMKDPRLCFIGTHFIKEVQQHGSMPAVLFTERHFPSCVYRLAERDDLPLEIAQHIQVQCWLYRNRVAAYCAEHGIPYRTVAYKLMTKHQENTVDALVDFLELTPTDEQRSAAIAHVRPSKNHWHEP